MLTPIVKLLFRLKVKGKENIPEGPVIVCANHTSFLDPVVLAIGVGKKIPLRFMAKKELFSNKILLPILNAIGAIPVNRETVDLATIRSSLNVLKQGDKLMLFPEGTRIREENASRENVKMGAGMLAARAGVNVVPVYISGNKGIFRRTDIIIGKPMSPITSFENKNDNYMNTAYAVFDEILRLGKER